MLSGGLRGSFLTPSGIGSWDVYPRLDDGSRMSREAHVRFCEGPWVKLPRSTHPYVKIRGEWVYLYRAVDRDGQTVDFRLSRRRNVAAAKAFLRKAMRSQSTAPTSITLMAMRLPTVQFGSCKSRTKCRRQPDCDPPSI